MSIYRGGKKIFNNYHYSHNQLSADNPFRYIDTKYNPFQPKINQSPQQYEETTANISQKNQISSPYERKSFYNNTKDNTLDNKPWSKTSSTSSLINSSYNILNNSPYSNNQNKNNNKYISDQKRDHVAELFNYTNIDLHDYYSLNKNQNQRIDSNYNNQNQNNDLKFIKTPQVNMGNTINNNFPSSTSNLQEQNKPKYMNDYQSPCTNQNKDRLFSPQLNNITTNINSIQYSNKKYNDNTDDKIYNYNKYNYENENINRNILMNKNNYNTKDGQLYTQEKLSNIELTEYSEDNCTSIKSYAYKENSNSGFRDYMEDKSRVILNIKGDPYSSLFCLFDGHGGEDVSKFLQLNFYTYFKEMLPFYNVKESLISLFKKVDNKIKESNFYNIGATACIIYITKENGQKCLYSANIGDTRSLLISYSEFKRLSYDHRANDPNEYKRIIDSGGVVFAGRVYGTLMLSRAFGDWELKPYGISNEPYVKRINVIDSDKYVVVASDGIWDVLDDSDVFKISQNMNNAKELCTNIVQQAIENGSTDNISCFVIKLN